MALLKMALWGLTLHLTRANARPVTKLEHHVRAVDSGSNKPSVKIIVPVVLAVVVSVMIVAWGWWRRRRRTRAIINEVRNATAPAANTTSGAGGANGAAAQTSAPSTGADAPARPPRRRRRRRPSQISTKSLPAYNEQAGDEEIVLVRRNERDSMSDEEYDDDSRVNRRSVNATSTTADAVPLLDDDSSPERPRVSLASSTRGQSAGGHTQASQSPTTPHEPNATTVTSSVAEPETPETNAPRETVTSPHPPDDVPAYSEAVSADHSQADSISDAPVPAPPPEQTHAPEASTSTHARQSTDGSGPSADGDAHNTLRPKRKSVFRQLFALNRQGSTSETPSESVELGSTARPSITLSTTSARTQSHHRSSASVSTIASCGASGRGHGLSPSLSSLILTRSRSPTRSSDSLAQRLNISAPISTTLVRTEFSYPRAGPTPEQIRFLSSRESLGRFGMPYGEEAIAAARSRENLSTLPPQYETPSSETDATASQNPNTDTSQPSHGPILYTPGELALRRTESSTSAPPEQTVTDPEPVLERIEPELGRIEPEPEQTAIDQHQEPNAPASPQSVNPRPLPSTAASTPPDNTRRDSVYTTHSFVTATEGDDTAAESEDYSDAESSPPTPTASTYREFGAQGPTGRPRGQTILIPEPNDAQHPQLTLLPATPTSTISSRRDNPT